MALSPMMQQYMEIKEQYAECILFFRLGDFYEMFYDDAVTAARELELVLTGKSCGQDERAPMCGVPFHAAENYIARLVEKGYKVAICEQMEDPALAKGIVKREVIQIVTPGTVTAGSMLNEKENNYLACVYKDEDSCALAYCDVSTGELGVCEPGADLDNELARIGARETIEAKLSAAASEDLILKQYRGSLLGLGLADRPACVLAVGSLLDYLNETQKHSLGHLREIKIYDLGEAMSLDRATLRNLEITESLYERSVKGSLLGVLDKCNTAMGSRLMKKWLREPLNSVQAINARLDAVECMADQVLLRNNVREALKSVYDIERLVGRIACGNANGKDMLALRTSLANLPDIKADLEGSGNALFFDLAGEIADFGKLYDAIEKSLREDVGYTLKEGGLILDGYSEELDALKASIRDAKEWIANLDANEKERTGIKTLKVGYNKVFGYYIEVSKAAAEAAGSLPENYIRKQTLVNGERYITPELKEMEGLVLNAETRINQLEYDLFCELRNLAATYIPELQAAAHAVASCDVLASYAEVSMKLGYTKPLVDGRDRILIEKGRHPVIEQSIRDGIFVSNDTYVDREDASLLLITGPNMAGKSTYMRQTALIVLMAQAGCFVPADKAEIGVCDRIFTRIGASDNLAQGQSTFFVEMSELAYILRSATEKSLVILDEIGRGTSTYDGLSIAWAVCEHLCKNKRIRTLFATHYHELTELEGTLSGFKNLNVDVAESDGTVVFLHKIVEGSASKSYGIHVARLAGVPESLLTAANTKLAELEEKKEESEKQLSLF